MIGIAALLVLFVFPVYAQDYTIDFYPVSYSGKAIDDGYFTESISGTNFELVLYGWITGDTADYIEADIYDDLGEIIATVYGHVVWNQNFKSGNVQATLVEDDGVNAYTFYIDGTLRVTGTTVHKFSFSLKGGQTYTNDGFPYIILLSSLRSSFGYEVDKVAKKDRGAKVGKRDRNIWKKAD
jgi:hypothetical protein